MKTYVIGDIHGAHKALVQCLERSGFNRDSDRLIALGDVCDGWPDVKNSIDELLTIKHLDYLLGNHDFWALEWATTGWTGNIWTTQGGANTILSYGKDGMPKIHQDFLRFAQWHLVLNNKLFVHAGIDPTVSLEKQEKETLIWDRNLVHLAQRFHITQPYYKFTAFDEIFVGHTTTQVFRVSEPIRFCNVWMLDTGAGWSGRLSIMNVDTKEFWQSDFVSELYPNVKGR